MVTKRLLLFGRGLISPLLLIAISVVGASTRVVIMS